jgi:hypothetical protein
VACPPAAAVDFKLVVGLARLVPADLDTELWIESARPGKQNGRKISSRLGSRKARASSFHLGVLEVVLSGTVRQ